MKKIIALFFIINFQILPQVSSNKFTFIISLGGGFASEAKYDVCNYEDRSTEYLSYYPDLSGKVGIAYESIADIYSLNLGLALEVGYFASSTSKSDYISYKGRAKQSIIPITISFLFDNDEILSPILKLGLGMGNKQYTEEYEKLNEANISAEKWFFIMNGGTGLSYKINNSLKLSLMLEAILINGEISGKNYYGFKSRIKGLQFNTYVGLQFGYSI